MIQRLLRICGLLASIVLGIVFLAGALAGVLLRVAAHSAMSSSIGSDEDDLRGAEKRANFLKGVKRGAVFAVVGLLVAALLGGFLIAASGVVPISASSGHWPITERFLQFAKRQSISTHSLGIDVPLLDDPDLVLKGATHYEVGCRPCHGSPGLPLPRIPNNMLPHPPDLRERIRDAKPQELFYVVKHGLKFTGMPAWPAIQREDEVWAVVAFLRELPRLDQTDYRRLVDGESPATSVTPPIHTMGGLPSVPRTVTQSCVRCHGVDGIGRGTGAFPKLAGQREAYLENALRAYSRGERHSGIMEPISVGLGEEAVREVARYYAAAVPADPAPPGMTDDAAIERGKLIAQHGIPAQRVPSCVDCHSPEGGHYNANYPALEAQHADYLLLQLELFNKGHRGGSAYAHVMEPIAKRLKPEQMRDVALYFQSLRPRHTAQTQQHED